MTKETLDKANEIKTEIDVVKQHKRELENRLESNDKFHLEIRMDSGNWRALPLVDEFIFTKLEYILRCYALSIDAYILKLENQLNGL